MSLLYLDSFDHYNTAAILEKWTLRSAGGGTAPSSNGIAAVGRRSTNGLQLIAAPNAGNSGSVAKALQPTGKTIIIGIAFKWTGTNNVYSNTGFETPCIVAIRLSGSTQLWFYLDVNSGLIQAYRGSTQLGVSTSGLSVATVAYLEIMATVDIGTGGAVQIRLNGTPIMSLSGINTAAAGIGGWDAFRLGAMNSGAGTGGANLEFDYDDLYVCDGDGPDPWNTFFGDCRVDAGHPTAEGAESAWTPLTGTDNAAMVKEVLADGDTSYVSSMTPGVTDTYVTPDAPVPGSAIKGVQVCAEMRKEDAGVCPLFGVARVAGVDYPLPFVNPGTTYSIRHVMYATNPATGLPWAEAEFNAAEFGVNRG